MRLTVSTIRIRYLVARAVLGALLFFCLIAFLLASAPEPPFDPFWPYASIFPGQPVTHAITSTFLCDEGGQVSDMAGERYVCSISPGEELFDHITLIVFEDTIQQVFFFVHDDTLKVGDLALSWGRPHVAVSYRQWISLQWPAGHVSATARVMPGSQFSYMLPLERVVFGEVR